MMGVCLRYAKSEEDAKDILNDGFIKVFRYLHKYKIGTSLMGWMRRIMINTAIDFYRKELRHRSEDIDQIYHFSSSDADAVSNLTERELLRMINELPTSYRTVFNLYAIDTMLELTPGIKMDELNDAMQGHQLAWGEMMGTYGR